MVPNANSLSMIEGRRKDSSISRLGAEIHYLLSNKVVILVCSRNIDSFKAGWTYLSMPHIRPNRLYSLPLYLCFGFLVYRKKERKKAWGFLFFIWHKNN